MQAHFVDRLLAKLEGAVSPIWITMVLLTPKAPSLEHMRQGIYTVFRHTPKLHHAWNNDQGWVHTQWTHAQQDKICTTDSQRQSLDHLIQAVIRQPADLAHAPAFRLHRAPVTVQGKELWAIAGSLHHALGDARALGRLLARLWKAMSGEPLVEDASPLVLMRDRDVLKLALAVPSATAGLLDPSRRLLSRRALAAPKQQHHVGDPLQHSIAFHQLAHNSTQQQALTFLAAALATTARNLSQQQGFIRLRMPVDLSRSMGWQGPLANTCMAIPLEFDIRQVRDTHLQASALRDLVLQTLTKALQQKRPITNMLECLISSWVAPTALLHKNASQGLLNEPRTNTLVTTYVGRLDDYLQHVPFEVVGMCSHTSTWGAHAWTVKDRMVLNTTAFQGLWSPETVQTFTQQMANWIQDQGLGKICPHSPLWET